MYKVMIVEDEPPIARMVKSVIESTAPDFSVAKCCMNGKHAVEALEKESFDIVITDIKMPVMTGLELASWIRENRPETMVIILSGYSDFEYARKAIEYKAFDYLLKPVSSDKVKELAGRIRTELGAQLRQKAANDERDTVIILACAGAYLLYGSEVMLPGGSFWSDERVEKLMERVLKKNEEYLYFNTNVPSERFIAVGSEGIERQEEVVRQFYEAFNSRELPVTVVYKKGVRFKDAGKTLALLREQLIKRLILNKSQIICCNNVQDSYENIEQPYSKHEIDVITAAIKNGNSDEVRRQLTAVFDNMKTVSAIQEEINGFLNIILDTYVLYYPKSIQRKNTSVKQEFINAIAGFVKWEAFIDDIVSILMTLKSDAKNIDRYAQLADSVEEYLVRNYNKSITNDVLAKEFGFVPSYISRIFKRQKGVSPNEYMTKYRIELAKRLISENPDMKVKEIANVVGFRESYYFSKTFKKETGVWPTEYNKDGGLK